MSIKLIENRKVMNKYLIHPIQVVIHIKKIDITKVLL
jgi:hypothetical protein